MITQHLRKAWMVLALAILALTSPVAAQDNVDFSRISNLAATDPAMALEAIDQALSAFAKAEPDPRILHDLTRLAAELLVAQGRHAEAAAQYFALGNLVARNRQLDIDPIPLWSRAVGQYKAASDLRGAAKAETAILAEQQDGGLPGTILAATMARLPELATQMGDNAGAARWQAEAKAALAPMEIRARGTDEGIHRRQVF